MRDRASPVVCAALVASAATAALVPSSARAQQPPAWRASLLREASAVTFGPEQRPVPEASVPRGAQAPGVPDMTFAPALNQRGDVRIAGRIRSRAAYPRLGIPQGISYLWVVSRDPVRMAIVPDDDRHRANWISTAPHDAPHSSGPCAINPFHTQFTTRRPAGGPALLAACTCVNGRWMSSEGSGLELLTESNARILLAR